MPTKPLTFTIPELEIFKRATDAANLRLKKIIETANINQPLVDRARADRDFNALDQAYAMLLWAVISPEAVSNLSSYNEELSRRQARLASQLPHIPPRAR